MTELWQLSAVQQAAAVRHGELAPSALLDAAVDRITSLDDTLHAFCELTLDAARAEAEALERRIARGESVGALAGVPIAVKDLISTRGVRTAGGTPAYRDFVPEEDDIVVERVRAADAMILGKTTVYELGYGPDTGNAVSELARNPWNADLTPGGSSSGSAVAVATGMSALALGSDGGGSIRQPASHCGVVGIKASMGRVPLYPGCRDERYPGLSSWESLEHIGPLARSVEDAALLLSVIAGPDPRDRLSIPTADVDWLAGPQAPVRGLRVGFSEDLGYALVDPEVRRCVRSAAEVFTCALGCQVEEFSASWPNPAEVFETLVALESDLSGMSAMVGEYGEQMSPHVVAMVQRSWGAREFTDAITARKGICNAMWKLMERYDLLLTPVSPVAPYPVGLRGPESIDGRPAGPRDWSPFTLLANLTGQPAASVPAGVTSDGLPVGLHIIGPHLGDMTVLGAAAAYQAAASTDRVTLTL